MERIGIYGGAFNPPHIGHIRAAKHALQALSLSKLLLIPSCVSPHKVTPAGSPTPQQRLQMLRLAVQDEPDMEVSDIELSRGGTSYTYETVAALHSRYPQSQLILLMGTDMFLTFPDWRQPEDIIRYVSLAVFYRGDAQEISRVQAQKEAMEKMGATVYLVENPVTRISSTDIRRMLTFDCARPYLPEAVSKFVAQAGLYRQDCRKLPLPQLQSVVTGLLKPDRVNHVLGCREAAVSLAKHWGANETDAARAALLHDITKALDAAAQLTLCREYGIVLDDFSEKNPKTLHALTGALVAQRIFEENDAVVEAIRSHTTGKANMNLLEKIIYVADYMEPNRDFPGVEELRRLAYTDLNAALKRGLEMTLELLKQQGRTVSPGSREALLWLQEHR